MSLPPSETEEPAPKPGMAQWRKVMLIGCLLLLLTAIVRAILKEDMPRFVLFLGSGGGYALLAVGFSLAARQRNERDTSKETPKE